VRAAVLPWLMVAGIVAIGAIAACWLQDGETVATAIGGSDDDDVRPPGEGRRLVIGTVVLIAVVLGSTWWLWAGEGQPLRRQSGIVPDYVLAAEQSPRATRTLIVSVTDGQASVSVSDANSPTWGSGEQSPIPLNETDRSAVVAIAGQFADGFASDDLASRLVALGIGHVVVIGVPQTAIDAMAGVPDLAGGALGNETVWTVGGLPSRAQLVDHGVTTPVSEGTVPAGTADRQLVLIERDDLAWRASIGGVPLTTDGSSTTFNVPAAGGAVLWWVPMLWLAALWHLLAVLVLVWGALPGSRSAEREAASEAKRAVT